MLTKKKSMKQKTKKIISFTLSFLFALSMIISFGVDQVFAEGTQTAAKKTTVTISNVENGTTATFYKIIDGNYVEDADGKWTPTTPQYTWNSSIKDFFKDGALGSDYSSYINTANNAVTSGFNATDLSSTAKKFYDHLATYIGSNGITGQTETATNAGNEDNPQYKIEHEITFDDGASQFGSYLVLFSSANKSYEPVVFELKPTDGAIPETHAITNLKKTDLSFTKTANDSSIENEGLVKYTITAQLPQYLPKAPNQKLEVADTLPTDLSAFVDDDHKFTATIVSKNSTTNSDIDLTNTQITGLVTGASLQTGATNFKVSLDLSKINDGTQYSLSNYSTLKIEYYAKLSVNSVTDLDKSYKNDAIMKFNNKPYTDTSMQTLKSDKTIYTYGIDFTKKMQGSTDFVNGCVFEVYNGSTKLYFIKSGDDYLLTSSTTANAVDKIQFTDNANSKTVHIYGLKEGTYSLKEIKTVSGYTIAPKENVTISSASHNGVVASTTATTAMNVHRGLPALFNNIIYNVNAVENPTTTNMVSATITNTKAFALPTTGDIGAILLVLFGISMIGVGFGFTIYQKKHNKDV